MITFYYFNFHKIVRFWLLLQKYANKLADILYKKLSNNQINNKLTKDGWSKLLSWTCKLDDMRCKHLALRYFNTWMNGYEYVDHIT